MEWIKTSLNWYVVLLGLGIIFYPITEKLFRKFSLDFGYPFAKILAILVLSYGTFTFGILKIIPFTRLSLFILLGLFLIANIIVWARKKPSGIQSRLLLILGEELLFIVAFLFWVYVRGQEPSVRGLEKFMDFGFINSILKTKFFPPLDIWLSADVNMPQGYPINYYYFGHLTGALLIKLSSIKASIGYNLILATIFALAITQGFSLIINIIFSYASAHSGFKNNLFTKIKLLLTGLLGTFIVNLGGNFHTIYLFTSGYPNEKPIPFWQILSGYNPTKYWYPNATRFIPFTIHEFPLYSYVVADLHGHVFDIPFVLLTLSFLYLFFTANHGQRNDKKYLFSSVLLGFMAAVHYMTNAFNGPIYLLLTVVIFFFSLFYFRKWLYAVITLVSSFLLFSLPFSLFFTPFTNGIGVNCSPEFLTNIKKIGPFLFEKGNCQVSPPWMLFTLWGFFWINFIIFIYIYQKNKKQNLIDNFIILLFSFGTFLIIIPEFFYIKDIYPAHFRANTMFKMGYQAFIMMAIASAYTFTRIKNIGRIKTIILRFIFIFSFFFVFIYPFFAVPSYYGQLNRTVELDGAQWLKANYPEDKEIIDYVNQNIKGQPIILEAQGDSYTDYERISSYTGNPTIAGWWVHEWLWRGSSDIVGKKIPDVVSIYESNDINLTRKLLKDYRVDYVVISNLERKKYPDLNEDKFKKIANLIFKSTNGFGALYQLKNY